MKKIMLSVICLFMATAFLMAQAKPAAKAAEPAKAKVVEMKKATGAKLKADGTPDMRYKENQGKAKAKPTGPTKADGTPDMRYKANQNGAKAPAKKAA
jgi:hypothetical protein